MRRISTQEVAERAGVDLDYLCRLVDLGLVAPDEDGTFSEGDARRARLYRGLERAGLPTEPMIEALERGALSFAFLDLPVYDRFAGLSQASFREVSSEKGIPLELLLVVREAMGYAQADADDRMRDDELRVVPIIAQLLSRGVDRAVIERLLRFYGDALRRVAETEADWWRRQIVMPSLASGLNEVEMMKVTAGWGEEFAPLIEQALLAFYRANQDHTWTENLIEEVEDALDRAGLRSRIATTPAICFLDITGYTRLTEERGDEAAAELVVRLTPLVQRPADRHGGKVVKRLGDGVMFHFRDPGDAVLAALEMLEAVSDAGLPPAHIGLDAGPVVFQGGDYFGRTVNLAARIAEQAEPGQVLVSQGVVDAVDTEDVAFTPIGSVILKGVSQPVLLHSAGRPG
ncbi:MAG TPA: adenylate/guanylate cyclase domain-containing protein [Actinomycetota bacterium]|nr:adenylate/guanylate cyclase domain-containing protein [Actinomycetota bacterium]